MNNGNVSEIILHNCVIFNIDKISQYKNMLTVGLVGDC